MSLFQKLFSSPAAILKVSIGMVYIILGAFFFVYRYQIDLIDPKYMPALVILFVAYGAFRLYRAVNDLKNE